jgi:hypothetical protein
MNIQTVHVTTRRPRDASDPGEAAIIYFVVDGPTLRVTDARGNQVRYLNGEPVKTALGIQDDPRQVAARLGHRYHTEMFGDRERGFYKDISRINGRGSA